MSNEQAPFRYSRPPVDPEGREPLAIISRWIGSGAAVLDLGASTGALARLLAARGCVLDGVEIDPIAAATARPSYRSLVEADLETARLPALFEGRRYDAVVCADILEHLRDPGPLLDQARELLNPDGALLVSLPNVGYAGVVLELLAGEFNYRPLGILDSTHVRFYTRPSLLKLVTNHGFHPEKLELVTRTLDDSEFGSRMLERIPPRMLRAVHEQTDALVYQFVLRAKLIPGPRAFATSPPLPLACFVAQLFWSTGAAKTYEEKNSVTTTAPLDSAVHELRFVFPASSGEPISLRLDPSDRPGFIHLHSLAEESESGPPRWTWLAGQGPPPVRPLSQLLALPADPIPTFLSLGEDPSLELILPQKVQREGRGLLVVRISLSPTAEALAVARGAADAEGRLARSDAATARIEQQLARTDARLAQTEVRLLEVGDREQASLLATRADIAAAAKAITALELSNQAHGEARLDDFVQLSNGIARLHSEMERLRGTLDEMQSSSWRGVLSRLTTRMRRRSRRVIASLLPSRVKAFIRKQRLLRRARLITSAGLFDAAYYRSQNPDVGAAGLEPLHHYLAHGAAEGRDPHEMFDTSYYLEQNPDVAASGLNPLLHFSLHGRAEGRRPHPGFTADQYRAATSQGHLVATRESSPTVSSRQHLGLTFRRFRTRRFDKGHPQQDAGKAPSFRTLVVSHVLPFPPRAGNEYRIHRMVKWLESIGHEVHLVVEPLPGESLEAAAVERAALEYPNLIVCERDGTLLYQSGRPEVISQLSALDEEKPHSFGKLPSSAGPTAGKVADLEQTFCPDHLLDLLLRLEHSIRPHLVICNYVFMSRFLTMLSSTVFKVIDTIDVFSTKASKVLRFGVADSLDISPVDEGNLLRRADLVVAIQPNEATELRTLVPDRPVVTAGVDFTIVADPRATPSEPVVLYVASSNALNVKGVRDFLSLSWPLVRQSVPDARMLVVGPVCEAIDAGTEGVELLGRVDKLDDIYARARVVVNLAVAGTGLKIKTLEALSHLRPIVVWPSGVDGLSPEAQRFCDVAHDWYDFARRVVRQLTGDQARDLVSHRVEIEREFSPAVVYAELRAAIEAGIRPASSREASGA